MTRLRHSPDGGAEPLADQPQDWLSGEQRPKQLAVVNAVEVSAVVSIE